MCPYPRPLQLGSAHAVPQRRRDRRLASQDPLPKLRAQVRRWVAERTLKALEAEVEEELKDAQTRGEAAATPDPETVLDFVTPPQVWLPGSDSPDHLGDDTWKLREAINETLKVEFRRNPDTFLWGQDCASEDKGGVFNVTKGMLQEFGGARVRNAPIAEDFIVGTANGICRYKDDIHVVIEAAQFADYVWPAMEQIVETSHDYTAPTARGRLRSRVVSPRAPTLAAGSITARPSRVFSACRASGSSCPPLRMTPQVSCGPACARGLNFFLEPKFLYNQLFAQGPSCDDGYAIPFGKDGCGVRARTSRSSRMGPRSLCAQGSEEADRRGDRCRGARSALAQALRRGGGASTVRKTGRVIVASEDSPFGTYAGEIAAFVAQQGFDWLDAPVTRVTSKEAPVAFSRILENARMLSEAQIAEAVRRVVAS